MRNRFFAFIAAFAALVLAVGAAYGAGEPASTGLHLSVAVEWLDGFTGHLDGVALAGAAPAVTGEVKEQIDKLKGNIEKILDLEDDIQEGKEAHKGVADLKEKVAKRSLENPEYIERIKELVSEERAEKIKQLQEELHDRIDEIETKGNFGGDGAPGKALSNIIVEAVKSEGMSSRGRTKAQATVEGQSIKEVTGAAQNGARANGAPSEAFKDITSADASAGATVTPLYREDIIGIAKRTPRVIDLLTVIRVSTDLIYFVVQATETSGAASQVEGQAKGTTDMTFDRQSTPVRTIAHVAHASQQVLDDATRLRDFIERRMRLLLELEVDQQVLTGDGTGENLLGLVPQSEAFDESLMTTLSVSSPQELDRIRAAILQAQLNFYPPTGMILHPTDWAGIELLKDANNNYLFVQPQNTSVPRLWGLPVVATTALAQGNFHVGNYTLAATFFDRQMASFEISTEHGDNFIKNMVTFLNELRAALAVDAPVLADQRSDGAARLSL